MSKTPTSLKDLKESELKAAATYFGTDTEGNSAAVLAGLVEDGVTWEDYVTQVLKETPEPVEPEPAVVTSNQVTQKEVPVVNDTVVTASAHPVLAQANYLIKMERHNPYFEHGKYKFTQDNPYNIMPAEDAQDILVNEDGFRQAFPDELQEYYS